MHIRLLIALAAAALFGFSQPVMSHDVEEEEEAQQAKVRFWTGSGEFGYVQTTGNTDTATYNLGLKFGYEKGKWRHSLGATALGSEEDGVTDAERYTLTGQSDYKISDRSYLFGSLRYAADKFESYDPTASLTAGYGYTMINTGVHNLLGEIGAGYRTQEERLTGIENKEAIIRGRLDYNWVISDSTKFGNNFLVEHGDDNTYMQNDTSLSVAINSKFAVKASYQIRHNSELPLGDTENTDTQFTTNLVYNF